MNNKVVSNEISYNASNRTVTNHSTHLYTVRLIGEVLKYKKYQSDTVITLQPGESYQSDQDVSLMLYMYKCKGSEESIKIGKFVKREQIIDIFFKDDLIVSITKVDGTYYLWGASSLHTYYIRKPYALLTIKGKMVFLEKKHKPCKNGLSDDLEFMNLADIVEKQIKISYTDSLFNLGYYPYENTTDSIPIIGRIPSKVYIKQDKLINKKKLYDYITTKRNYYEFSNHLDSADNLSIHRSDFNCFIVPNMINGQVNIKCEYIVKCGYGSYTPEYSDMPQSGALNIEICSESDGESESENEEYELSPSPNLV